MKNWKTIGLVTALLGILAAILHWMGRIPWCKCGRYYLWEGDSFSSHTSQHLLDPYSFSHLQHGLLFFFVFWLIRLPRRLYIWAAILVESAWEITENSRFIIERHRAVTISLDYFGDSIGNSLGDVLSCLSGYYLASKLPWRTTLLLYALIEIAMLVSIRDSLTLNVIMLIIPSETIREWQMKPHLH